MKKFLTLHYGFEKPTPEIMGKRGKWFESITDKMDSPKVEERLQLRPRLLTYGNTIYYPTQVRARGCRFHVSVRP